MKKYTLLVLPLFLFCGCKKNPFDYRTKYVGNYTFTFSSYSWDPLNGVRDTSYSTVGKVDYGSDKNQILVFLSSSWSQAFTIYEDGTIEGGNTFGCEGEFESEKKLKYSCYWASPGAHSEQTVVGTKQ